MKTLNELSVDAAYEKARRQTGNPLALELHFTRVYRENREAEPATRELHCLRAVSYTHLWWARTNCFR